MIRPWRAFDAKRSRVGAALAITALLVIAHAAPAQGATQLGQTFAPSPDDNCPAGITGIQINSPGSSYAAPFAGVITSWSFQADGFPPQSMKLKVGRPAGSGNFTVVGESDSEAPLANAVNSYATRISVRAGDVLGFYLSSESHCAIVPSAGYNVLATTGDIPVGITAVNVVPPGEDAAQIDLSAVLETDADGDGFGDETQDACPGQSGGISGCPLDTAITKQPAKKTRKKKATFEFTSSVAGVSFECSLDGEGFAACVSPRIFRVGKGKHVLQVRAKTAGEVDPTPATSSWKVKKKKKKKK